MYRVVNNVPLKFSLDHVGLKCFSLKEENVNVSEWLALQTKLQCLIER